MTQRDGAQVGSEPNDLSEPLSSPAAQPNQAPTDSPNETATAQAAAEEAAADPRQATEPPGAEAAPEPPSLEAQLEEARELHRRTRDQLLRAAADYDNLRKRGRRDLEEARRRSAMATIRELLPVFDNLERAASVQTVTDTAAIAEGLRLVLRQFVEALRKLGVDRIDAVGGPFDPASQESLQMVESGDLPAGSVVAVIQPGYRMGTDLIRPAMVVVSKGPPPSVREPASDDSAPSSQPASTPLGTEPAAQVEPAAAEKAVGE